MGNFKWLKGEMKPQCCMKRCSLHHFGTFYSEKLEFNNKQSNFGDEKG